MHCTEWIKDTAVKIYHCSLSVLESVKSYLPALSEMWGWLLTRASLCMITSVQQLGLATFTSTLWQQNKENSTAVRATDAITAGLLQQLSICRVSQLKNYTTFSLFKTLQQE